MQNPVAMQVHYDEYQNQMAWVNQNDWQFERPAKRHPVRQAIAKALLILAEAQRRQQEQRRGTPCPSVREGAARALIAVATRLAPSVTTRTVATAE